MDVKKNKSEKIEKQTAISIILCVAIGALVGLIIGYFLFKVNVL